MLPDNELAEIWQRWEASTKGEWISNYTADATGPIQALVFTEDGQGDTCTDIAATPYLDDRQNDFDFIANVHQDIPRLRAHIEGLTAERENLKLCLSDIYDLTLADLDDYESALSQIQHLSRHKVAFMDTSAYAEIEQQNERLGNELTRITEALALTQMSAIYADFADPADAIAQMATYIRELEASRDRLQDAAEVNSKWVTMAIADTDTNVDIDSFIDLEFNIPLFTED